MSSSSQPSANQKRDLGAFPLRHLLAGLALLTLMVTIEKVVGPSAPMPTVEPPARFLMAGYRISTLPSSASRRGRDLSFGTMRQFRLVPLSGEPPLT